MKKSVIALLLVVALVVTVSVFAVSAESAPTQLTSELTENGNGTATGYCPHCEGTATFTAWTPGEENTKDSDHYYLAEDQENPNNKYFNPSYEEDLVIHLNGHTLQRAQGCLIISAAAHEIWVLDNSSGNGTLKVNGAWGDTCGVVNLNVAGASFNLCSGNIVYEHTKGTRAVSGGVFKTSAATTFNIYGGTVTTDDVTGYGAVGYIKDGTVNIYGGTINGGGGAICSGAFHMCGKWRFTMSGGTITGGSANNGGNIYFGGKDKTWTETDICIAEITGGTISGGTASTSGGNLYMAQDAVLRLSNCTITGGTANGAAAATNVGAAGGGNIYLSSGSNVTVGDGAVVSNGTAVANGGNIAAIYGGTHYSRGFVNVDGGTVSGGTAACGGNISIGNNNDVNVQSGGTVSGGTCTGTGTSGAKAAGGGNIWAINSANVNVKDGGTVTGGKAENARGGNIYSANGSAKINISGGLVTLGTAYHGGNVALNQSGGTLNVTGGTISAGSASVNGGGIYGAWGSKVNMSGTAKLESNTAGTSGGNAFLTGVGANITGGTVTGGTAASLGGNIAFDGSSYGTITNTTITKGAAKNGGNIALDIQNANQTSDVNRAAGITLGEGTVLSEGKSTAFGGNIYITNAHAIVILDGAVLDGAKCTGSYGTNIGVWNVNALTIKGDTVVKNGGSLDNDFRSIYLGDNDDDGPEDTVAFDLKVILDGNADVDYIYFSGYPADQNGRVYTLASLTVKEGFAGSAKLVWQADVLEADKSLKKADFEKAGTVVPSHVTVEENYANTADIYVLDNTSSQKPVAYYDTNADGAKELATTGMTGVAADGTETTITALPTDDTYAYVKLYAQDMELVLTQDTTVDYNNMATHFVTGEHTLTAVNYRNSDGKLNAHDKGFTVDNAEKLKTVGRNPVDDKQYVVIPDGTTESGQTKYTAHHLKVKLASVSIKPASAAMYYNVEIVTNAKLDALMKEYGVVLSLANMPGADFDAETENLWTKIDYTPVGGKVDFNSTSALLEDILVKDAEAGVNKANGEKPIYANAYVTLTVGDQEVKVMADKTHGLSLLEILQIVDADENLASHPSVVTMYKTWDDPMASWTLDNIRAAAEA